MDIDGDGLPLYSNWETYEAESDDDAWKRRMIAKIQAYQSHIARLEAEGARLRKKVEAWEEKARLPHEILVQIFERALPPNGLLDRDFASGRNSTYLKTLRTKTSIVRVSRPWYTVGMPFLYKDICIRHLPQIFLLHRTLKEARSSHLASFIKSLQIFCFIPDVQGSEFDAAFSDILEMCQATTTFSLTPPCRIPIPILQTARFLPASVTRLRLGNHIPYRSLISILFEVKESLQYLMLQLALTKEEGYHVLNATKKRLRGVRLPVLEELFLEVGQWSFEPELLVITEFWTLPALNKLSIINGGLRSIPYTPTADNYSSTEEQLEEAVVLMLERHGAGLTFLQFDWDWLHSSDDRTESVLNIVQMLGFCPLLERLVIFGGLFFQDVHIPLLHSSLRWLDISIKPEDLPAYEITDTNIQNITKAFPSLQGIRQIIKFPPHAKEWLTSFDPDSDDFASSHPGTSAIHIFQHRLTISRHPAYLVWEVVRDTAVPDGRYPPLVVKDPIDSGDSDLDYEYEEKRDVEESGGSELSEDEMALVHRKRRKGAQTSA